MKFQHTKLPNGLTLIGEERSSATCTAIGFFVKTGARDESPEILGVSHFLEHMMFKGTKKRSALDITYQFGEIGAQSNAYTSEENTVYYAAVLPEYFSQAMDILSDMLRPALDEKEFDTEKKVILEEIALYQDRPSHVLFETAMAEHFKGHTTGRPVLGTTQTITALTREQMKNYFDARYAASNIILAAAGNFSWDEFTELAIKYCGKWEHGDSPRVVLPHHPTHRNLVITRENLQRAHLAMIAPGPSATEEERYAAHVLSTILGDSSGSRMYWELIDKGLADSATIDTDEMEGTGMVMGYVSADPERIDQVGDILLSIMKSPRKFSEEDLKRAKTKLGTALVLHGESTMRRLIAIGSDWLYRKKYHLLEEELAEIKRITKEDIYAMLERYSFEPTTSVKLVPA